MKKYIKLVLVIFVFGFLSCNTPDGVIFDSENGQTLAQFSKTTAALATPEEGTSVNIDVLVTTLSNSDREIFIEIDPSSTATPDQYSISNLVIPAGKFNGTITISGNFDAIPEMGSAFLTLKLTGVEGSSNIIIERNDTLNLEFFRKCPFPSGDYILELFDSYGDGWDGAIMRVTIDGESEDFTAAGTGTTHIVNVPDGTEILVFTYITGSFESEHSYIITSPNGIEVKADGPSPTPGDIMFNPCNI
ncbi:MAG TPA: hypothetical protein ENK46_01065 [Flavobacteriia bacterium]|nr:hypothetical protein [Flavobacteriia bacterium]